MKKILAGSLLALAFIAAPCRAQHCCSISTGPISLDYGAKCWFSVKNYGCTIQAGPWYTYWPLEAHFQVPAPAPFPYWPGPMTSSAFSPQHGGGGQAYAPPTVHPNIMAASPQPNSFQPVGYFPQAPSYWYNK
jgi:hypothetical protein